MGLVVIRRIVCDRCGDWHSPNTANPDPSVRLLLAKAKRDGWREWRPPGAKRNTRHFQHFCPRCIRDKYEEYLATQKGKTQ